MPKYATVKVGISKEGNWRTICVDRDGVGLAFTEDKGATHIEWVFDQDAPEEVTGVEIRFLAYQPAKYPTHKPIPRDALLTDFGEIEIKPGTETWRFPTLVTTSNPRKKGYFFYQITAFEKNAIWAVTDPGGSNDPEGQSTWPPTWP